MWSSGFQLTSRKMGFLSIAVHHALARAMETSTESESKLSGWSLKRRVGKALVFLDQFCVLCLDQEHLVASKQFLPGSHPYLCSVPTQLRPSVTCLSSTSAHCFSLSQSLCSYSSDPYPTILVVVPCRGRVDSCL